jgi:geranylgeranyl diphosphate synthase type I
MFGDEKKIGKSILSDLQESKKTLLIWKASRLAKPADRKLINQILAKEKVTFSDLTRMREVVKKSGSLDYARKQIKALSAKAVKISNSLTIPARYKEFLLTLSQKILS